MLDSYRKRYGVVLDSLLDTDEDPHDPGVTVSGDVEEYMPNDLTLPLAPADAAPVTLMSGTNMKDLFESGNSSGKDII